MYISGDLINGLPWWEYYEVINCGVRSKTTIDFVVPKAMSELKANTLTKE